MTNTDTPDISSGEQRARARRRSFWRFSIAGLAIAVPAGASVGYLLEMGRDGIYSPAAALVAMALSGIAFVWFTIGYYRRVDEVDFTDNLWAGFIALHVLLVLYPGWLMLHILDLTPPPTPEGLWFGTIAASFIAYGWRKWRNR